MGVSEILTKSVSGEKDSNELVMEESVKSQNNTDCDLKSVVIDSCDDREEGEIVDDYEFIISSDEELCMRQRIEELEATNAELEKIAKISGNSAKYNYVGKKDTIGYVSERCPLAAIDLINSMGCQRAAQVPTDASSISSVEFPTPKKRKRRKTKAPRATSQEFLRKQHTSKQAQKHRNFQQHKKYKHVAARRSLRNDADLKPISLYSCDSSEEEADDNDSGGCFLSREELRFAVARSTNTDVLTGNLKDRLEKEKRPCHSDGTSVKRFIDQRSKGNHSIQPIVIDDDESSDTMSLEEQELRLIALKSAVMKKHLARKKRDAEVAYSPTDFDDLLGSSAVANRDDDMDVVEVEIDELDQATRNSMEISPVGSPKLLLSPVEDENSRMSMATEINEGLEEVGNTKLVDMDIANSDSEVEVGLPVFSTENKKWTPLEQIPLPNAREPAVEMSLMAYDTVLYPNPVPYATFLPELHLEPPPLPPGVSDYDEQPPPPPPFHLQYSLPTNAIVRVCKEEQTEKKVSKNVNLSSRVKSPENSQEYKINDIKNVQQQGNDNIITEMQVPKGDENIKNEEDEEEAALRALLLSKFNSPKARKPKNDRKQIPPHKDDSSPNADDSEQLRSFLLTSMVDRKTKNPTESILKEAVRRLQMKTKSRYMDCEEADENSMSSADRFSKSCSPVTTLTTVKDMDEIYDVQNTNAVEKEKLELAIEKNKDLTAKLKEVEDNSQKSIQQNKPLVTVRTVEKINQTFKLKKNTGLNCHLQSNEKQNSENSLNTENLLSISIDTALKSKVKPSEHETCNKTNGTTGALSTSNELLADGSETIIKNDKPIVSKSIENLSNNAVQNITPLLNKVKNVIEISTDTQKNISDNNSVSKLLKPSTFTVLSQQQNKITSAPFRSNKIVKPNKVINPPHEIIREPRDAVKTVDNRKKTSSKPVSPIPTSASCFQVPSSNSSRLITNVDIPTLKVKQIIISIRASDTDTSDEENIKFGTSHPNFEPMEPLICTINNDYFDNASPISLPMDSPGPDTPNRANSPAGDSLICNIPSKSVVNDCFEEKLNSFLKSVRTQVQKNTIEPSITTDNSNNESNIGCAKPFSTPVAVRHLPHASQQEYRRLVHRMQLLEKQKQAKSEDKNTIGTNSTDVVDEDSISMIKLLPPAANTDESKGLAHSQENLKATSSTLIKKVLLKNANQTVTTPGKSNPKCIRKIAPQIASKANVLRAYESSFSKIGAGIINNLDKSLHLVEEAKQAKMEKLRHEKRLQELRAEMDDLQLKLKHEQKKMSRIYPEICESNEVITTLKQRRGKLFKAASNLGKVLKGDDYRLNNELKEQIAGKTKTLAAQIKVVNSMKYSDIENVEIIRSEKTSEQEHRTECIGKEKIIDDCKQQNIDLPFKSKTTTAVPVVSKSSIRTDSSQQILHKCIVNNEKKPNKVLNMESESEKDHCISTEKQRSDVEENKTQDHVDEGPKFVDEVLPKVPKLVEHESEKDANIANNRELKRTLVMEYISPLTPIKTTKRTHDPNGVICPYDLMGQCEDNDCNYVHLNASTSENT